MTRNMHVYSKFTDMFKNLIKGTYVHELTNICSPKTAISGGFDDPRNHEFLGAGS